MSQVHVLTLDSRAVDALENAKADLVGRPPKGSPYYLTKSALKFVKYVPRTNFQVVEDLVSGRQIRTREWLRKPQRYIALERSTVANNHIATADEKVIAEIEAYRGQVILLDGVTGLYGIVSQAYTKQPCHISLSPPYTFEKLSPYLSSLTIDVYRGQPPKIVELLDAYMIDHSDGEGLTSQEFQTTDQMIAAIAQFAPNLKSIKE